MENAKKKPMDWLQSAQKRVDFNGRKLERPRTYSLGTPTRTVYYRSYTMGAWANLTLSIYPEEDSRMHYLLGDGELTSLDPRIAQAFKPARVVPLITPEGDVRVWRWWAREEPNIYSNGIELAVERMVSDWMTPFFQNGTYHAMAADDMDIVPAWPDDIDDPVKVLTKCLTEQNIVMDEGHGAVQRILGVA